MFTNMELNPRDKNKSTMFYGKHLSSWNKKQIGMSAAVLVGMQLLPDEEKPPRINVILTHDMLEAAAKELKRIYFIAKDSIDRGSIERGVLLAVRGNRTALALSKMNHQGDERHYRRIAEEFRELVSVDALGCM